MTPLVYSTECGRICPQCGQPARKCVCHQRCKQAQPAAGGPVRVVFDTKGRKGKAMTVITGLKMSQAQLEEFARFLKQKLGTGGSVKDGAIELQGDQREKVLGELP